VVKQSCNRLGLRNAADIHQDPIVEHEITDVDLVGRKLIRAALQARPQFAEACRRQEVRLDGIQPLGSRLGAVNSMLKAMFAMPLEKMGVWL